MMISQPHFKHLEYLHKEMARVFRNLQRMRATTRDKIIIQNAEMEYYQIVQRLYRAVEDAAR